MDDAELARRSIRGFGETVAALGRSGVGPEAEIRRPGLLGARIDAAAGNPWFDAAVVPLGAAPPAEDPSVPGCVWTVGGAVPGRVEAADIAMPCLGLVLDDPAVDLGGGRLGVEAPSLAELGEVNERAYDAPGTFGPLMAPLRDERVRTYGLRDGDAFVCVAMSLAVGDDLSVQYVATDSSHRRRGLAGRLMLAAMAGARDAGMRTATLQASPDGLSVYERLGFRRVATLRAYVRATRAA